MTSQWLSSLSDYIKVYHKEEQYKRPEDALCKNNVNIICSPRKL